MDFYSWEWSPYCTRLKDGYGMVPRQYAPRQALHLSFLKGARIPTFSSNDLSSSPHTWAQPIPTAGPCQPPLDLLLVLPFPDPSVLSPQLSFKSYCPNEGSRLWNSGSMAFAKDARGTTMVSPSELSSHLNSNLFV